MKKSSKYPLIELIQFFASSAFFLTGLTPWCHAADQQGGHTFVQEYQYIDPISKARVLREEPLGQFKTVALDPSDAHFVHLREGGIDRTVFFYEVKDAQVFKRALESHPGMYALLSDWKSETRARVKVEPNLDGYRVTNGPGAVFETEIRVGNSLNHSPLLMSEFIRNSRQEQIREDELLKGNYQGLLGLAHQLSDRVLNMGIYDPKAARSVANQPIKNLSNPPTESPEQNINPSSISSQAGSAR